METLLSTVEIVRDILRRLLSILAIQKSKPAHYFLVGLSPTEADFGPMSILTLRGSLLT